MACLGKLFERGAMLRALIAFVALSAISACEFIPYGASAPYADSRAAPAKVVMPANAPSISAQFRLHSDNEDVRTRAGEHLGMDVIETVGTPVLAVTSGTVLRSYYEPMYGHQIVLDQGVDASGASLISKYRHLDTRLADAGDTVKRGQQVGTLGTTGLMSQGFAHLHFELWRTPVNGYTTPVDPQAYWVSGPGQVTCFERRRRYVSAADKLTYPVACKSH